MTVYVVGGALIVILIAIVVLFKRMGTRDAVRRRTQIEDALKHLFDQEYRGRRASFASLSGTLRVDDRRLMQLLGRMQEQGLVTVTGREFELTPDGTRVAGQIVRAHRLLERYFADEARLPLRDVHAAAERQEHKLTPEQVDDLAASLGHPQTDPHGDPIPGRDGQINPAADTPVTLWPIGRFGRITHLEDEPPLAFAQILAQGLRIGQVVRVLESTAERVVLTDGENDFRLAPAVAANVFLAAAENPAATHVISLADLPDGETAEIVGLDPACQGFSRRRLMDLGFTPGAHLAPALETFAGDPRAYRIRGTLVALRRDQARQVLVRQRTDEALLEHAR
jgi:DtxR family transcriptional regulator, Mn-dependent transcriptional regulator